MSKYIPYFGKISGIILLQEDIGEILIRTDRGPTTAEAIFLHSIYPPLNTYIIIHNQTSTKIIQKAKRNHIGDFFFKKIMRLTHKKNDTFSKIKMVSQKIGDNCLIFI